MYSRFKIEGLQETAFKEIMRNKIYQKEGTKILNESKDAFKKDIVDYLNVKGALDSSDIIKDWFPSFDNIDVFLSHAHKDEGLVLNFAGYLKEKLGLNCFIDSTVWGDSTQLLKEIDDQYCRREDGFYDYNLRNQSTAHVHMILDTALQKMINKSESFMLIETPNSITSDNSSRIGYKTTYSPWLYSEIETSRFMAIREPTRNLRERKIQYLSKGGQLNERLYSQRDFKVEYDVNLRHLKVIQFDQLEACKYGPYKHSLDNLYFHINKNIR